MTDKKQCSKCDQWKYLDDFDEGKLCCRKCNEYRKAHRHKHKDRSNEAQRKLYQEDKEYRLRKQEQRKLFDNKVVSCSVCNKSMSQKYFYDHIKTKKYQKNLEMNKGDKNRLEVLD